MTTRKRHKYIGTHFIPLLAVVLLLSSAADAQAQRRRRGGNVIGAYPVVGVTTSQIRGDELRGFDKWSFTAGVGADIVINDDPRMRLSLEADYSQRGAYNATSDPYRLLDFTMQYVDIPLTFHFTDPYGGLTIGAGLVYSRLVKQPHGIIYYNPNYFMPDTSDMSFLPNDLSFAIDVRFPIWRGLTFNFRWQHSMMPVKRNWQFTGYPTPGSHAMETWSNDLYNSSISVRLLYIFGDNDYTTRQHHKKNKNTKHRRR